MREKLQVWSEAQGRWKTVYVLADKLMANITLLRAYGIRFRVKKP